MIDVEDLLFDHPAGRALHAVGFVARAGSVTGLVGPEGAGKSTLLRCIATLETPGAGRITVAGRDTVGDPRGVHAILGYLPRIFGLYDALTVGQCLRYAARSRGVPAERAEEAAAAAAELVGLATRTPTPAGALTPAERRRLALAQAIVHRPRVLLLDEPALGDGPGSEDGSAKDAHAALEEREALGRLIARMADEGATVMVSAASVAELPAGCTDLLELDGGRVLGEGVRRLLPQLDPAAPAP